MGIIKAFDGALTGAFADQWKDIISAGRFNEYVAVTPGILQRYNNGRGSNDRGSFAVLSNGSKIFVPENTAAFIFNQAGIDEIIVAPGGYEYQSGEASIFNNDGLNALVGQVKERMGYGGVTPNQKKIAYVNLREIRNLKFKTRGPQIYNDKFYGCDLEVFAEGTFTIKIEDPAKFVRNYLPPNVAYYSFDSDKAREQITIELLQSFNDALNTMSAEYRVSQIPSRADDIVKAINSDETNAGTWRDRFGFAVVNVAIANIELSETSKELIKQYSANRMNLKAYEDISKRAADISAQQKVAEGVMVNGMGDGGGMIFGMNMAQGLGMTADVGGKSGGIADGTGEAAEGERKADAGAAVDINRQIETLKKLKELADEGILTQEEFDLKKKEIMKLI